MKIEDADFQKRIKAAAERKKAINDVKLSVLEGHALMEEALDTFIEASLFHSDHFYKVNPNFRSKGHLAWSLGYKQDKDTIWYLIWAITELRNTIAHKLDADAIDGKLKHVRMSYIRLLGPAAAKVAETQTDKFIAEVACQVCAGFLAALADDAKARRRIIDQHWKGRA